jgi:DNA polymerase I
MSKILIVDGHNFMYRARSGFQLGSYNVVYNFVRNLRSLVEQMAPTRVYFTLEGAPRRQLQVLPSYKANRAERREAEATKPVEGRRSEEDYRRQQEIIVKMLTYMLPITVVQHRDFEADDLIYNLVKRASSAIGFTVVSTDTDFIQMLQEFPNVKLYNPVTKAYVEAPEHDYVVWKALRGDGSDNIPGLPSIGDVRANELAADIDDLRAWLSDRPELLAQFTRNHQLIALAGWTDDEAMQMQSSAPQRDWNLIKGEFESMAFKSMLKESTWDKFVATFDSLYGNGEGHQER